MLTFLSFMDREVSASLQGRAAAQQRRSKVVESNVFIDSNEFASFGLEDCRGVGKDHHRPTEGGYDLTRNDAHVKNTERTGRIFQQNDTR
jgi:hypothetical protein